MIALDLLFLWLQSLLDRSVDFLVVDLGLELAAVADITKREVEVLAVETDPVAFTNDERLVIFHITIILIWIWIYRI